MKGNKKDTYLGVNYLKSGESMLKEWSILLGMFFFFPLIFFSSHIMDMAINGGFIFLVFFAAVFSYCLRRNFLLLYRIAKESDVLKSNYHKIKPNTDFKDSSDSILAVHIRNLMLIWKRSGKRHYSQENLVDILHAKLKNEGSIVVLASNVMITLGLIGTISGLISSIGGLQEVAGSSGIMSGVTRAIDGMGVAFYTTLIGSALGGITLRILYFYVDKQVDSFVFTMAETVETRIIPYLRVSERQDNVRDITMSTVNALRLMGLLEDRNEIQTLHRSA